jgi:hypothetical protein
MMNERQMRKWWEKIITMMIDATSITSDGSTNKQRADGANDYQSIDLLLCIV